MGVRAAVCVFLLTAVCTLGEKHSLFYIYSALNKDVNLPGIYEFTALGLLDDREIDYYNSKDQVKVPKQTWMKEKMQEDYWEKGTQSRKSKEQWFKVNVGILMERMRHNNTDLHVLQWRHGCEAIESSGNFKFLRGIDEYSYDGSEFLSFDDENSRWIAPVQAAEPTKRKWDGVQILNQYTKGYLEKECVDWLGKFMDYGKESLRKHSPPDVHAFAKQSVYDPAKLTLTCLATGFYPKDVKVCVRKSSTSLPEHLLTSSGVRPNEDGTYQLRMSVEIEDHDTTNYDCYVSHRSFNTPVIKGYENLSEVPGAAIIVGALAAVCVFLALLGGLIIFLKQKGVCGGLGSEKSSTVELQQENQNGTSDSDSGRGSGSDGSSTENIKNGSSTSVADSSEGSSLNSVEKINAVTPLLEISSCDPNKAEKKDFKETV